MARRKQEVSRKDEIRQLAEQDLLAFIRLVHPNRVLGKVHEEIISWWNRSEAKTHQLLLLPRDHQKSALVAYRVAWEITRNPSVRILYISSTSNLATKQLKFIKDILLSDIYTYYWPEMVNEKESEREKWTETEISVDHPLRKNENVRDPTVFTAGLTTSITGLHCDVSVFDDVVVYDNAYTEEGREKVAAQYSLLASIEGTEARQWVVGTRYHPLDLYQEMMSIHVDQYDEYGDETEPEPLYEKFERQVESIGDGTGEFIWPVQQRKDGQRFGFNQEILARKRAQYLDRLQFRAQYYNDPNDAESAPVDPDKFQYYNRSLIKKYGNKVTYNGVRLNVFAGVDFAYSTEKRRDYTAIVVVGVDPRNNYYILDIERFKTDRIKEYFEKILMLHQRWGFRKIRAEITSGQKIIVKDLKENYILPYGLALSIEEVKHTRHEGTKYERISSALHPRYDNMQMWHYKGGNCQVLEEELVLNNPPHDDVKDALALVIEGCTAPTYESFAEQPGYEGLYHPKFGGIG